MKKLFFFILVLICIGWLICCPSFREDEAEVASENTLTDFEEDTSAVFEHPVTEQLYAELDSNEVYDEKVLFGYWFKPHEANAVNIFLHKDYTYEFNYYIVDEKAKTATLTTEKDNFPMRAAAEAIGMKETGRGIPD